MELTGGDDPRIARSPRMRLLMFSGIALVLLCGALYAEDSTECVIFFDATDIRFESEEAEKLELCNGCLQIKVSSTNCECDGDDQCQDLVRLLLKDFLLIVPLQDFLGREGSRKSSCWSWPCDMGDGVGTIPEVYLEAEEG